MKITKLRCDISSCKKIEFETLYDTWGRYKELLRKCPKHGLVEWMQIQIFYNRLNVASKKMLDVSAEGSLRSKQLNAAQILIEEMGSNGY